MSNELGQTRRGRSVQRERVVHAESSSRIRSPLHSGHTILFRSTTGAFCLLFRAPYARSSATRRLTRGSPKFRSPMQR